jgi:hypothetical protein
LGGWSRQTLEPGHEGEEEEEEGEGEVSDTEPEDSELHTDPGDEYLEVP